MKGGRTDEINQDPENAIAGIYHNGLDAIVEDSKESPRVKVVLENL